VGIPTLVLGATADPATPVKNAHNIYRNLSDGYLILKEGGSHVIFGYGDHCPDDLVTDFLVDGQRPPDRETTCPGDVILPYTAERRSSR
jgi:TAP-like protein